MRSLLRTAATLLVLLIVTAGCGAGSMPSVAGPGSTADLSDALAFRDGDPSIEIVAPGDGAIVVSPVALEVDVSNFTLSPSGTTKDGEGHFHVLVDQSCLEPGVIIPNSTLSLHAGDGTDTVLLDLAPGRHKLCVQIGDGFHVAVAITDQIVIEVRDEPITSDLE